MYAARGELAQGESQFEDAVEYLSDHPWLTPPPELASRLGPGAVSQLDELQQIARARGAVPDPSRIRFQQKKLDAYVKDAAERINNSVLQLKLGYKTAAPTFLTLITCMFMHADIFHLLGNMLFFFATGPFLEDVFGRPAFIALYFSGGVVATWVYAATSDGQHILIGASGAVAALMGAYLIRFLNAKVEMLFIFFPVFIRGRFWVRFFMPAYVFLPFWFCEQVWDAVTSSSAGGGVAFWAHIGGFVYGAGIAGILKLSDFEKRFVDPQVESQTTWKQNEHLIRASEARAKWDFETARKELRMLLAKEPNNIDGLRAAYDVAVLSQNDPEIQQHATSLLEGLVRMNEHDLTVDLLREVNALGYEMPERFYARAGTYLDRVGEREWALEYCSHLIDRFPQSGNSMRALMQSARIYRHLNRPDLARIALDSARKHPACNTEWQQTIAGQLAEIDAAARVSVR